MRCPLSPATGHRERTTAPAAFRRRPRASRSTGRRKQSGRTSRLEPHASVLGAPRQSEPRCHPEVRRDEQQAAVHRAGARDIRSGWIAKSMRNDGWFGDRIKVLVWDQTGIVLVDKRFEGAKFVWPTVRDGVMTMSRSAGAKLRRSGMTGPTFAAVRLQAGMSPAQFSALFEGLDWRLVRPEAVQRPARAG